MRIFLCFLLSFSCILSANTSKASLHTQSIAFAAPHPLARETAQQILEKGGNAFDAAVAVAAVLAVVQPYASGLGGGGWWLLQVKDNKIVIDSREVAPSMLPQNSLTLSEVKRQDGALSALIPGEPAAFDYIASHYGSLPLETLLAPAILYAKKGFKTDHRFLFWLNDRKEAILKHPYAASIFFESDLKTPKKWIVQPELAVTLEKLAKQGRKGFYAGSVAKALVRGVTSEGGVWSLSDLNAYEVKVRDPIATEFEGFRLTTVGPPSVGGMMLISMLDQLRPMAWRSLEGVEQIHTLSEVMRRAACDRNFVGDPDFVKNPTRQDWDALHRRMPPIKKEATSSTALPCHSVTTEGEDTTHFVIHDAQGNRAAVTLSNNFMFGSGYIEPRTGVLLNNHLDDFTFDERSPNRLAPKKRSISTIAPVFFDNDCLRVTLGTPGGARIASMDFLALLEIVKGKSLEQAIARPRFHQQLSPDEIQIENKGFDIKTIQGLQARQHKVMDVGRQYGDMQGVLENVCEDTLEVVSDMRGVGRDKEERLPPAQVHVP